MDYTVLIEVTDVTDEAYRGLLSDLVAFLYEKGVRVQQIEVKPAKKNAVTYRSN